MSDSSGVDPRDEYVLWVLAHNGREAKWHRWTRADLYPHHPQVEVHERLGLIVTDADATSSVFPWPRVVQWKMRPGIGVEYQGASNVRPQPAALA